MLYLDNAATSRQKPAGVYFTLMKHTVFGSSNAGRGSHRLSIRGMRDVVDAQDAAAELFKIRRPENIAFTMNATYALNMAIKGTLAEGDHVIATEMDHNSVLRPVYEQREFTIVKADSGGVVDPADIERAIRPNTRLIVCTHASNVCGAIQNVKEIGEIARRAGALFLLDAAQTAGCVDIDVNELNVDLFAFSGHKGLMGPLGTGGLYVRRPELLRPIITGGTGSLSDSVSQPRFMPDMLHSGTINTPGVAALASGIKYVLRRGADEIGKHERELADFAAEELKNMGNVTVYGSPHRIGTVAFNIADLASEAAAEMMEDKIALRAGYHCAPLAHKALGTSDRGAVRASFGAFSKRSDAVKLVDAVYKISVSRKKS